jgi:hypothetical protein
VCVCSVSPLGHNGPGRGQAPRYFSLSVLSLARPGTATIQIGLEQEFQARAGRRPGRRTPLRLDLTSEQLRTAAAEWDDKHRRYPGRMA